MGDGGGSLEQRKGSEEGKMMKGEGEGGSRSMGDHQGMRGQQGSACQQEEEEEGGEG